MNKKNILYLVGGIALVGIAYWIYDKNKKALAEKQS